MPLSLLNMGKIGISAKADKDRLIVYVRDTGPGIEKSQQKLLFKRYTQVGEVLKRKFGGTGLGLFITRFVAQKMGGDAWLESSTVGKGSTFAFSLPIVSSQAALATRAQFAKEAKAKTKLEKLKVQPGVFRQPETI